MRILVTNDDGIKAEGIRRLAEVAKRFGEVWVVAPETQCSAMSHRLTVQIPITVRAAEFPVDGVKSYQVGGTPADCIKAAVLELMPEKPDLVFSGINYGYNAGADILYSGTVGACMEALTQGIPSIAFSYQANDIYDTVDAYIEKIAEKLLGEQIAANEIWNVNFPGIRAEDCKGIKWDCTPAKHAFYIDHYLREELGDGGFTLKADGIPATEAKPGTDIAALLDGYISVGKIRNTIL